jgi:hypothetical protein
MADADLPLSSEARFAEALAELPAVERSALALSEIGGLDTNEIAERLGTDPAVVHKLLTRARESMRTTLAVRGRRGLTALLPLQSWWQTGSAAPAMRAAGLVAAAVIAPSVIGGAADSPRAAVALPESPRVAALEWSQRDSLVAARARTTVVPAVAPATRERAAARVVRPVRPGAEPRRRAPVASAPARRPTRPEPPAPPAVEPERPQQPQPPAAPPPKSPETVATTVQRVVTVRSPLPPPPVDVPEITLPPVPPLPVPPPPVPAPPLQPPDLPPVPPPPPLP